jgi:hypothetical protein
MYLRLAKFGIGSTIMCGGLAVTAAISPLLWLSGPLAVVRTVQKIKDHPGIKNPGFEPNLADSAVILADCAIQGFQLAIEPIRGSLDIALLGACIITEA